MISGSQMKAARALLAIDQKELAVRSGVSVPTIQRMEASEGSIRAIVGNLDKVVAALNASGIEFIASGARSQGQGRGVRLVDPT